MLTQDTQVFPLNSNDQTPVGYGVTSSSGATDAAAVHRPPPVWADYPPPWVTLRYAMRVMR
jgi:hypothetical protein